MFTLPPYSPHGSLKYLKLKFSVFYLSFTEKKGSGAANMNRDKPENETFGQKKKYLVGRLVD